MPVKRIEVNGLVASSTGAFLGIHECDDDGYRRVWIDGKFRYAHRELYAALRGEIPPMYVIHHIDGDKSNNKLSNLRAMSRAAHRRLHARKGVDKLSDVT